jgi:pimeloyl-ACP methyl ester carboxylesterase
VLSLVASCGGSTAAVPIVSPTAPPARSAAASGNFEQLVGGKLWFRSFAGSLPAILLEAGGGAHSSSWKDLPQRIAHATGHRVVAYDRAGFGKSPFPAQPFTITDEITDLHRSLSILGIDKVVVVGESYGAMMALALIKQHAGVVAGLVLLDPMNVGFVDAVGLERLAATVPKIDAPKDDRQRALARMIDMFPTVVDELRDQRWGSIPAVIITAGIPFWPDESMRDPWRASHEVLARTRGARLVVAEKSTHLIAHTEPELVIDAVKTTLALVASPM